MGSVNERPNERLRFVLTQRGIPPEKLAEVCSVDPKTVDRWISTGRTPHRRHRFAVAQRLGVEETYLWPPAGATAGPGEAAARSELIDVYQNRASVHRDVWISLLLGAVEQIDVLVFSGTFFAQSNPRVAAMLAERASDGVQVRLCFGDPEGRAVAIRDAEEGLGGTLAAKIKASLTYYRKLPGVPGCEVRLHDTTLYNSLFRYDDILMVNPHIWGQPASANPLLHLQRLDGSGWFDHYMASFDAVWETARPWAAER
ncbi:helix-turn-helix domain-containing protein [Streptantibioticus ferralitis]|uniref:Helix-turn-helix transcriptional regulator n=1 Tax=Streptantibioticus ferralitis TaxID=236510 RepID=A0ABT5YS26_9ACTN|nr:helix-turn-helix transcriptional regulator [Streptantibioticus ferralitis]MDF2254396.1 helix-turn-helix transcriptional regulator [Streptantibioticus ferralitis]